MRSQAKANDKTIPPGDDSDEIGEFEYRIRPRVQTELTILLPVDVLASIEHVAEEKSTSVEALIRLYIGGGLREDIARLYGHRVLASVARVLARHIESPEEVEAIVKELRDAAGGPAASWFHDPK